MGYSPQGHKESESDMTERLSRHIHTHTYTCKVANCSLFAILSVLISQYKLGLLL